jgi:ATP-binding cassette, subfamily B, bacterial MsbA
MAHPLGWDMSRYTLFALLAVIFGLFNFTLFIPLLNLLFNHELNSVPESIPTFEFSAGYVAETFEYYFLNVVQEKGKEGALAWICWIILLSVALANFFRFISQMVLTTLRTRLVKTFRQNVFEKLTHQDLSFFSSRQKGQLLSTLSNDVHEVENSVVSSIQVIIREPLMLIGFFFLLFNLSVSLTLFSLILLPLSFLVIAEVTRRLKKDAKESQHLLGSLMSLMEETISGIRIIKGFNAEKLILNKFEKENDRYRQLLKSVVNKRELASPLSEFLGIAVLTVIFYFGGKLVIQQSSALSASQFITYIILYSQILIPAKNISTAFASIQKGMISGKRLFDILDSPVTVKNTDQPLYPGSFQQSVEFANVDFWHGESEILKNINLKIEKGKTLAIVGPSGAGKSTLVDLIPRFYDVKSGVIKVDKTSIQDIDLSSLRKLMGIVNQETILFNDTIYNNIAFAKPDAAKEEVFNAARIANALEFIEKSENGFDTIVGDRGMRISGGQRQRISIARAILKNPPILIMDEATSALDTENEILVQEALARLMQNRTTIVVAHRLSTIQKADQIIVMDQGRIVESGNHSSLLAMNGLYRKLYDLQSFD